MNLVQSSEMMGKAPPRVLGGVEGGAGRGEAGGQGSWLSPVPLPMEFWRENASTGEQHVNPEPLGFVCGHPER